MTFDDVIKAVAPFAKGFQPMNNAGVNLMGKGMNLAKDIVTSGVGSTMNTAKEGVSSGARNIGGVIGQLADPPTKALISPVSANVSKPTPTAMPTPTPMYGQIQGYTNGPIPSDFVSLINSVSQKYNIHPAWIASHLNTESGFNPTARNQSTLDDGRVSTERGSAQISDIWWPNVTDEQADNPEFAVDFLGKYLSDKLKYFDNPTHAAASYNVGYQLGDGYGTTELGKKHGLGPAGSNYMNAIIKNLSPDVIQSLGLSAEY